MSETDGHHYYLGVYISDNLTWNKHIHQITSKANRSLGFIRRNLYSCPQRTKEAAYKTLVRPLVEYSSAVWDPHTNDLSKHLESVQKRAARFVCGDFTSRSKGCVSKMITSLNWDSLAERRKIRRLTVLQQARSGHLSLPVGTLLQPAQRHSRHLNSNAYITLSTNKDCMKYSYFARTVKDWNSLPEHITNITSIPQFKEAVHHHLQATKGNQ